MRPHETKSFCKTNDTVNETKWQPTEWEDIFTNSYRRLVPKIYKELKKLYSNTPNNPVLKWRTDINRKLSIEKSQITEKRFKEMFNILKHQGNANQNHSEIQSYTCQNG